MLVLRSRLSWRHRTGGAFDHRLFAARQAFDLDDLFRGVNEPQRPAAAVSAHEFHPRLPMFLGFAPRIPACRLRKGKPDEGERGCAATYQRIGSPSAGSCACSRSRASRILPRE